MITDNNPRRKIAKYATKIVLYTIFIVFQICNVEYFFKKVVFV